MLSASATPRDANEGPLNLARTSESPVASSCSSKSQSSAKAADWRIVGQPAARPANGGDAGPSSGGLAWASAASVAATATRTCRQLHRQEFGYGLDEKRSKKLQRGR